VKGRTHRDFATPCFPGFGHIEPWQFAQFVAWSPDGSLVYFSRSDNIFVAAADGSRVWQIVDPVPRGHEGSDGSSRIFVGSMTAFSVSPDGARLAYSTCEYPDKAAEAGSKPPTNEDYQYEIALVATGGGNTWRLTTRDSYENFPAWSPDGTRIAFLSGGWAHLYTMAADGSDVRDFTRDPHWRVENQPPQWSPDGRWLAFVAHDHERTQALATVRTDGTDLPARPAAPSTTYLTALYVVRADGTDLRRLAAAVRAQVSWSPDGQRLAFAQADDDTVVLATIAADGTDAERVTRIDGWQPQYGEPDPTKAWIQTLAWSPAGDHVLFTCGRTICVSADAAASSEVVALPVPSEELTPWPVPDRAPVAAWSPDGSRIAVATYGVPDRGAVLYLMSPDGTGLRALVRAEAGGAVAAARESQS